MNNWWKRTQNFPSLQREASAKIEELQKLTDKTESNRHRNKIVKAN